MTPVAIGRHLRALRHRERLRQCDLGRRVRITQSAVSRVERGDLAAVSFTTLTRLFDVVGGELVVNVRWRGGEIDRLMDRAHAQLVERIARRLTELGWAVHVEVSFAQFGERGSIDVLGLDEATSSAVVVEVKSGIYAVEETLRRHDTKVRLAPAIIEERFGLVPRSVSKLLVLPDSTTARRRIAEHALTFERAYPHRGKLLRDRLAVRREAFAGLLYLGVPDAERAPRRRVRLSARAA
jgi:transcriptional regulator with XRE-family HTH domain